MEAVSGGEGLLLVELVHGMLELICASGFEFGGLTLEHGNGKLFERVIFKYNQLNCF